MTRDPHPTLTARLRAAQAARAEAQEAVEMAWRSLTTEQRDATPERLRTALYRQWNTEITCADALRSLAAATDEGDVYGEGR